MNEKILVIDKSAILRNYLKDTIEKEGFEVLLAKDGLDGLIKMRNQLPDLVIMDYYLPKLNGLGFLKEKLELKGTADIPVIILSFKMDRQTIINISKYKIYKILYKPIEIDSLFNAIGSLFNMKFDIDKNPCIIDVHLNDDILFIEIANGLNKNKINLLKYKIQEIQHIYDLIIEKILIIFSDISQQNNINEILTFLMEVIRNSTKATPEKIKILTENEAITNFFSQNLQYKYITITNDFTKAIDSFGKIDINIYGQDKIDNVKKNIISSSLNDDKIDKTIKLVFSDEKISEKIKKDYIVAVIDDDLPILEFMETVLSQTNWKILVYENGKLFLDDLNKNKPDLIFLDLLMPVLSGFEVLDYLNKSKLDIPVIILTAYPDKNSILKARNYGVKSYLTKPVKADLILHKAEEILSSDF